MILIFYVSIKRMFMICAAITSFYVMAMALALIASCKAMAVSAVCRRILPRIVSTYASAWAAASGEYAAF